MECPACRITNPPEAQVCDCGFDFRAGAPADFPDGGINLAWRQMLAAFWSISWPASVGAFILVILIVSTYALDAVPPRFRIAILGNLTFYAIQALLTRRIVRKNYRSFRVHVVRSDGLQSRNLSIREASQVWLRIFLPQFALVVLARLVVLCADVPEALVRGLPALLLWLQFVIVGPYAVGLALRAKYRGFRFLACGFRYV